MTKQSMKRGMGSPSNVEVPLSTEEAHVHLHLGVQVAHPHLNINWLRYKFFFEKYQMTHIICTNYGYPRLYYTPYKSLI